MAQAARTIRDGFVVGIIGYFSVAVFYAVFDVVAARGPLYTVDLLGKSLLKGLRDAGILGLPIEIDVSAIFWYNALHLVISLAVGLVVIALVELAERRPSQARFAFVVIVGGFVVTIFAVGAVTSPIRALLPWWSIVVANVLAVLLAGTFLLRKRPGTWRRLSPFASA